MSAIGGRRRVRSSLIRLSVLACTLATLVPAAFAQQEGSETEGQDVSVSHGEGGSTESSGEGSSCSGGSEVTVVTDEGTSHPSGGSRTCATKSPTQPPIRQAGSPSTSTNTATPSPAPETVATTAPPVAETSPFISLQVETPEIRASTSGHAGKAVPFVLVAAVAALAASVYLIVFRRKGSLSRVAQRSSHETADWIDPFIDGEPIVRVLPRTTDQFTEPVAPEPTEPISIEAISYLTGLRAMVERARTETDILTTEEPR